MSAMVNRRIRVHIMPRMSFRLPSIISRKRWGIVCYFVWNLRKVETESKPSGPMLVSLTPRDWMKSKALVTFSAFWTRIRGFLLYRPKVVSPWMFSQRAVAQACRTGIPIISYTIIQYIKHLSKLSNSRRTHHELDQPYTVWKIPDQRCHRGISCRL